MPSSDNRFKLPWSVQPDPKSSNFFSRLHFADSEGGVVLSATLEGLVHTHATEVERERAAFIKRAVNSHEGLVEALESAYKVLARHTGDPTAEEAMALSRKALEVARA